ncbi:MAG: hypothetical protein Q8906_05000 [Bacillota bacterium]|nr:hypothetical protein [Bacillota bacterium]MDP4169947.1 hypothetical protein [Bacillota bacterium]
MDENRKKIILNEIQYWKEGRMLPAHYCDYLLSLYSEGNPPQQVITGKRMNKNTFLEMLFFIIVISIAAFVTYFTELSFILQIGILVILGISGVAGFIYFLKKGIISHLSLVLSAFMLLLASVEAATKLFSGRPLMIYIFTALNCLAWIVAGWKRKLLYFSVSGFLGIGVLSYFIFVK